MLLGELVEYESRDWFGWNDYVISNTQGTFYCDANFIHINRPIKGDSLDEAVRRVVNKCINQPIYKVNRVAEKKYIFGEEMSKPVMLQVNAKVAIATLLLVV